MLEIFEFINRGHIHGWLSTKYVRGNRPVSNVNIKYPVTE